MQTFLTSTHENPLRAAQDTFAMLDRARLGKQRVEAAQLLNGQWPNHPASKMWRGHEHALTAYAIICCKSWIQRGHDDSLLAQFQQHRKRLIADDIPLVWPWWYGYPAMVRTHQTKLYHKNSPRWVNYHIETAPRHLVMRLPYIWPHPDDEGLFTVSVAEAKRGDWEIPSSWSFDPKSRVVIPR
jgi:hypothetical protein